jgi:hypothetical protein
LKSVVVWDVTPCGSCKNRRFGGTFRLHHQAGKKRRNRYNVSRNCQSMPSTRLLTGDTERLGQTEATGEVQSADPRRVCYRCGRTAGTRLMQQVAATAVQCAFHLAPPHSTAESTVWLWLSDRVRSSPIARDSECGETSIHRFRRGSRKERWIREYDRCGLLCKIEFVK